MRTADFSTVETEFFQTIGDVEVGHRAKQTAIDTGLARDPDNYTTELFGIRLRGGQFLGRGLSSSARLGFEFLQAAGVARLALPVGIRKLRA
jgi:hypothetical protein